MSANLVGKDLGSYTLISLLSESKSIATYKGVERVRGKNLVVKVFSSKELTIPDAIQAFLNQAQLLSQLDHPHLLPIKDFGEDNGILYIVEPFLKGGSLQDRLAKGAMPVFEAVNLFSPLADALDYAHSQGHLHLRVHSRNILFDQDGKPFLADLASSALAKPELLPGDIDSIPTVEAISPEQVQGEPLNGRADQYALGVLIYHALTGKPLFEANTPAGLAFKHATETPISLLEHKPELSEGVERAVLKALTKHPDERFPTVCEMVDAIVKAAGIEIGAEIEPASKKRKGCLIGLAVLIGIFVILVIANAINEKNEENWRRTHVSQTKTSESIRKNAVATALAEQGALILRGHYSGVYSVAWSPDGRLASGSLDHTVIVWDLETCKPEQVLQGEGIVNSVAWSPDGRLASGSYDGTVIVWNLETGEPEQVLHGHYSGVESVVWSPDGRLASGSMNDTVIIWDLETGEPEQVLLGHTRSVYSVAWSLDGRLASGSYDGTVIVWNLETGEPEQVLQGQGIVNSVAWSPDGRLTSSSSGLASGLDETVIIWNLESGEPEQVLYGHTGGVYSEAWSPDGRLASGSYDDTVIIWNLETGEPEQILQGHEDNIYSVAWSPDGRLASGSIDGTVIVWPPGATTE